MKVAATLLTIFVASIGALSIVYPWSIYYGNFEFGRGQTLWSYVFVALVLVTAFAIHWSNFRCSTRVATSKMLWDRWVAMTKSAATNLVASEFQKSVSPCPLEPIVRSRATRKA